MKHVTGPEFSDTLRLAAVSIVSGNVSGAAGKCLKAPVEEQIEFLNVQKTALWGENPMFDRREFGIFSPCP